MIKDVRETAINFDDESDYATYFVGQKKYINKLKKQAEMYPDEVQIRVVNPDGSIVASIPKKWFKPPAPPKKVSDERRAAMSERSKKYHEKNKSGALQKT